MGRNNIVLFTKDMPKLEGSGKSIRLMNWLSVLSKKYTKVYCVFMRSEQELLEISPLQYPLNVELISIQLQRYGKWLYFWRRIVMGLFRPDQYNLYWFNDISLMEQGRILEVIKESQDVLFFRLYLYPVIVRYYPFIKRLNKMLDLDDDERATFSQIRDAQWKQGYFKEWLLTCLGYYFVRYYEKAIQSKMDILFYANPLDHESLTNQFPNLKIYCFPNKVVHQLPPDRSIHDAGSTILFCGALNYFPNIDATKYLLQKIWPLVLKELPQTELIIAGSNPSRKLQTMIQSLPGTTLIKNPRSMTAIFQKATLLLVPLRLGGGTRIKILQAFSFGIPVISTTIGISGISALNTSNALIADDATGLSKSCIELLRNPTRRKQISRSAYEYFSLNHSFKLN